MRGDPPSRPGSSPLTRGKPVPASWLGQVPGLIPAHAGKTSAPSPVGDWFRAHPRSRGENRNRHRPSYFLDGSSPLTRGKLDGAGPVGVCLGLIPAHAGKTTPGLPPARRVWAHPRSRGENEVRRRPAQPHVGSSPLTRGKPLCRSDDAEAAGLIPAHAGKTRGVHGRGRRRWAHPRSRGENCEVGGHRRASSGSSPLTRGKLPHRGGGRKTGRLIPAHAGKTVARSPATAAATAHPRSRGENRNQRPVLEDRVGSSPLTRGKHRVRDHARSGQRLIPAHAGKTRQPGWSP